MNKRIEILRNVLGDCKRAATSICLEKTSYETTSLGFFFISDDKENEPEEPIRIVGDNDNYQLRVKNKDKRKICLIKTDNCLFNDTHQKCDCILFSDEKYFLVEISDGNNKNRKRNDAVEQLGATIQILRDNNIDLSIYDSKAIICFKSGKTKPIQSSFNTKRAIFLEQYQISLEEGNLISF